MSAGRSRIDELLRELADGDVVAERYSRKSMGFRCRPLLSTTALAVFALVAGMLLGGAFEPSGRAVAASVTRRPPRSDRGCGARLTASPGRGAGRPEQP